MKKLTKEQRKDLAWEECYKIIQVDAFFFNPADEEGFCSKDCMKSFYSKNSTKVMSPKTSVNKIFEACGNERPPRKVFCQLKKGHKGSCQAVIFWEENK